MTDTESTETLKIHPDEVVPLHEVQDFDKLEALTDDMTRRGWVGEPVVVVDGEQLGEGGWVGLTGSHRAPAAGAAGVDVVAVDVEALLPDETVAAAVTETAERLGVDELTDLEPGLARHELAMTIDERLPLAVRERYGMDAH